MIILPTESETQVRLESIRNGPWARNGELARREIGRKSMGREALKWNREGRVKNFDWGRTRPPNAALDEQARKWLRPHWEKPASGERKIAVRESLDEALTELQLYELAVETGYLSLDEIRETALERTGSLLATKAARKFVDDYDYVAVTWLADRLGLKLLEKSFEPPSTVRAEERFASFLAELKSWYSEPDLENWLGLLDDYDTVGDDGYYFARFLEGKKPPRDYAEHFGSLLAGAQIFVIRLAQFAATLTKGERPRYGSFFAYWLARFFGEDLGANGYSQDSERENWSRLLLRAAADSAHNEQGKVQHDLIWELKSFWEDTRAFLNGLRSPTSIEHS